MRVGDYGSMDYGLGIGDWGLDGWENMISLT